MPSICDKFNAKDCKTQKIFLNGNRRPDSLPPRFFSCLSPRRFVAVAGSGAQADTATERRGDRPKVTRI